MHVGRGEIGRFDLTVAVHPPAQLLHPGGVDVEADDARPFPERDRHRQPDVSEPDDRDGPPVPHQQTP